METLQKSLDELATIFSSKMSEFQEDLRKAGSNPETVSALTADYNKFKTFAIAAFGALQTQVLLLGQQQDLQEMRSRCEMLLFHGVEEDKQEDISVVMTKIIADRQEVSNFTVQDIARCQRLGRLAKGKARPILVKFSSQKTRDKVWFSKTVLKGSGVTISEFLTRSRHMAFMAAREHFGVAKCWTRDGFIHIISTDGSKHRVSTMAEVDSLKSSTIEATPKSTGTEATSPKKSSAATASRSPNTAAGTSKSVSATSSVAAGARLKRGTSKK